MRAAASALRIAALGLLVGALAACSGGGGDRAPGTIVEGGVLRLGLGAAVQPDPALANLASPTDLMILDLLHGGLTNVRPDGGMDGDLALSWSADPTYSTWMFTLSPTATFSSGRRVTSADVIASLERVARAGDTSLAALRLEAIAGFRAFVDGEADHLAGLTTPDDASVQIALSRPLVVLPVVLASPQYGIVDVASLDAAAGPTATLEDLDLSGAWEIREASGGGLWLEARDGHPSHLDGIVVSSYDTAEAAFDAFDAGREDWALVPVDRFGVATEKYGEAAFTPFHAELFFGMRLTSPSLANRELRRAIASTIDREAIVSAVYPDLAEPLSGIVPDGVAGWDRASCADCGYPHDPDKAAGILAAAFPDGPIPSVAIDFDESPAQAAMARIIARDLEDVGITTHLRPKPLAEYQSFVVSGAQELFSFGWIGGYQSPDAYLAPMFGSTSDDNLTGYAAPGVDEALDAARSTADRKVQARRWADVERQVLADAVVVPVAQFRTQAVAAERVRSLRHEIDGSVDWSAVWVADGA